MEKREYNLGIALLRIWMCFEVVLCHFRTWTIKGGILYEFQGAAVPVFMLVAFVFCDVDKLVY